MHDNLASAGDAGFARTLKELEELDRIPSVSAPDFDAAEVQRSAEAVADLATISGMKKAIAKCDRSSKSQSNPAAPAYWPQR